MHCNCKKEEKGFWLDFVVGASLAIIVLIVVFVVCITWPSRQPSYQELKQDVNTLTVENALLKEELELYRDKFREVEDVGQ